jgi:hypothetical protein
MTMAYCTRCVYPLSAVSLDIDEEGICSACRSAERFAALPAEFWTASRRKFEDLVDEVRVRNATDYDCLIPVSGGKDSYYQAHMAAVSYGLKPLLVTYHGNNFLPEGDYNRDRMRHVFDADHLVFGPSVEVLKKLNRLCFRKMGGHELARALRNYDLSSAMRRKVQDPADDLGRDALGHLRHVRPRR